MCVDIMIPAAIRWDGPMDKLTYTVPEAGKLLGIGRNSAYAAVQRGEIPVLRLNGRLVVPKAAFHRMLGEQGLQNGSKTDENGIR